MTRARRLRRNAPHAPGTDARHRRESAARRRSVRRAGAHTPPRREASGSTSCMPAPAQRCQAAAPATPPEPQAPPGPVPVPEPDSPAS
jgi:hypothetical protein